MNILFLPLVNWAMGAAIIGIFALVCIVMIAIVMNLIQGDKKDSKVSKE